VHVNLRHELSTRTCPVPGPCTDPVSNTKYERRTFGFLGAQNFACERTSTPSSTTKAYRTVKRHLQRIQPGFELSASPTQMRIMPTSVPPSKEARQFDNNNTGKFPSQHPPFPCVVHTLFPSCRPQQQKCRVCHLGIRPVSTPHLTSNICSHLSIPSPDDITKWDNPGNR